MSWANCGWNEKWKVWMGYAHDGVCMHDGCEAEIDHGLSYACGSMHEGGDHGCGKYCCEKHLSVVEIGAETTQLCAECEAEPVEGAE